MEELQIFNFDNNNVRTIVMDDEPYFLGKDVAEILGYARPQKAVIDLIEGYDRKTLKYKACPNLVPPLWVGNDYSDKTFINESGLYDLIFGSNLPSAKKFKRWVTKEVLPSIRKTGGYGKVPQSFSDALRLAADLEEEKLMLEQKVAEYEPKIGYLDMILSSDDTVTTSQIAADYGLSAISLNKILHELNIQHKVGGQWLLYKKHMNQGYTKSHTSEIPKTSGGTKIVMNTKWTQKGRLFIYEYLKEDGYLPEMDKETA